MFSNDTGEDNAEVHMKRQIMGREVVVAVTIRTEQEFELLQLAYFW